MTGLASERVPRNARVRARRREGGQRSRTGEKVGIALLAIVLVGSALLFGAQQTPVLVGAALASSASAWLLRGSKTPRAVWLLVGLALYTLLQIVPLPLGWVLRLSPASAAVWQGALRPFAEPAPAWVTLSMDPGATALEAVKWFSYACLFVAAMGFRVRRGAVEPALLIFGCGALVAFVTLVHGVLGFERVYGLYIAPTPSQWLRGPFVNGNNLAGYLNLGIFAGLGLLLMPERKLPAWPFLLALPAMGVLVLLSESRAGVACLVVGALASGYAAVHRRQVDSRRLFVGVASVLAVAVAAVAVFGPRLALALSDRSVVGKVSGWKWSLELIADFPVFGVGRGAFETAFQPYRRLLGGDFTMVFPYAENFLLQWAADWGLLVAPVALGAGIAIAWAPFSRAARDPLAAGLVIGLGVLLLQNLADLGLEIFGVSALAIVAFAVLAGSSEPVRRAIPVGATIACAGAVVSVILVLVIGAQPVRFERRRVSSEYSAWVRGGSRDPVAFLKSLRAPMLRHPGEAYFPLVGSVAAAKAGSDPLKWIGRALERSPLDGQAHLFLANVLASRGAHRQALFHLRLTAVYDSILRDGALWKAVGLVKTSEDLASAFPRGLPGANLLPEICKRALGPMRVACWREVVARDARDPIAKRELAAGLLDALEGAAVPCQGEVIRQCRAELGGSLRGAEAILRDWRVRELRARELALDGNFRNAAVMVLEHCPATHEAASCCERALDFARRAQDLPLLAAAADRYTAALCTEPRACAVAHERVGRKYQELSAFGTALRHFLTAAEQDPSVDRWLESAEAAARAGSAVSAQVAFERARREGGLSAEQRQRIEAVQAKLNGIPR